MKFADLNDKSNVVIHYGNGVGYSDNQQMIQRSIAADINANACALTETTEPSECLVMSADYLADCANGTKKWAKLADVTTARIVARKFGDVGCPADEIALMRQIRKAAPKASIARVDGSQGADGIEYDYSTIEALDADVQEIAPVSCDVGYVEYPHKTETANGKSVVLNTASNLDALIRSKGMTLAKNMMTLEVDMMNGHGVALGMSFDAVRSKLISAASLTGLPKAAIDDHMTAVAEHCAFHPVQRWIDNGGAWDGVKRVDGVLACFKTDNDTYSHMVLKRWLVSAVAAIYEDTFNTKLVPVLHSDQSYAKTAAIGRMVNVTQGAFLEGAALDPNSKDSLLSVTTSWIVELGELERTTGKEQGALKAFITSNMDKVRPPYGRSFIHKKRQTVMIGTVNGDSFLRDETGNSRYAPIKLTEKIDVDGINAILGWEWKGAGAAKLKHPELLRQFWLEIKSLYESGMPWGLSEEEQAVAKVKADETLIKGDMYEYLVSMIGSSVTCNPHEWRTSGEICQAYGIPANKTRTVGMALTRMANEGLIEAREGRARMKQYRLNKGE